MNKLVSMNGAALLGKEWACDKGHKWVGEQPTRWQFQVPIGTLPNGQVQAMLIQSGPVCLQCLLEWASATFPMREVDESEA